MNVKQLQEWLNNKGASPKLVCDGIGGPKTRSAFIQVFKNKNATSVTQSDILEYSKILGDASPRRLNAIAKVESSGNPYDNDGMIKILWERHYFYKFVKKTIYLPGHTNKFLSLQDPGDYTIDFNKNNINDSWEKLSYAVCIDPLGALQSISIGKFQVMGIYYKKLGWNSPIDMLYDASRSEAAHYKMLVGYILNVANLKSAFLRIDGNKENCRAFAKGYNGSLYAKYDYHTKIAKAYLTG